MNQSVLLFDELNIRGVALPNKIVVSPMCMYSALDGLAQPFHAIHYGKFALGGAGTAIVEATAVSAEGRISNGCLGLWSDAHAAALQPIAASFSSHGVVPGIQLNHAGRKASAQRAFEGNGPLSEENIANGDRRWEIIAPSAVPFDDGWLMPQEMTRVDMDRVKDDFAAAAHRAVQAGFRLVELHMAHGYLLQSFLSPLANKRTDAYGGSLENRMAFPLEVAHAVRGVLPSDIPLFARISATDWIDGGWEVGDSIELARRLKHTGVDLVVCSSGGNLSGTTTNVNLKRGPAYQAEFSRKIRTEAQVSTATVGLIRQPKLAESLLRNGYADLIAVGREMLLDPFWAHRARAELIPNSDFDEWPEQYGWWLSKWKRGIGDLNAEAWPDFLPHWSV